MPDLLWNLVGLIATATTLFGWWREYRKKQRARLTTELFDQVSPKIEAWLPGSSPLPDTLKNLPSLLDPEFTSKIRQ